MSVPFIILSLVILVVSLILIVVILMQSKNVRGFGSVNLGGMGNAETYWDKNKGRSLEGKLEKYTKILGAVFLILAFAMIFVK